MSLLVSTRSTPRVTASAVVALVGAALLGFDYNVAFGLTVGTAFAAAFLPVWARVAAKGRAFLLIAGVAALAAVSGIVLTATHAVTHSTITAATFERTALLANLVAGIGFLLWSHRVAGVAATCVAFGVGAVLSIPLSMGGPITWRFTFSIPVTLLVLALVSSQRRVWLSVTTLVALAGIGLLNDSRSNSSFLLLAAAIMLWQRVMSGNGRHRRGIGLVIAAIAIGVTTFLLLQAAIVEGAFGEATRTRTVAQLEATGGNLFLGARPEAAAASALVMRHPWGLGSGVKANYDDIAAAKQAMASIGYDPNNGYVQRYMFGSAVEVHSVLGDLWIWFGLAGAALVAVLLIVLVQGATAAYENAAITALLAWITLRGLWDLAFSPFSSALYIMMLSGSLAIAHATYAHREKIPSLTSLDPRMPRV
jgi:hypothetical protein